MRHRGLRDALRRRCRRTRARRDRRGVRRRWLLQPGLCLTRGRACLHGRRRRLYGGPVRRWGSVPALRRRIRGRRLRARGALAAGNLWRRRTQGESPEDDRTGGGAGTRAREEGRRRLLREGRPPPREGHRPSRYPPANGQQGEDDLRDMPGHPADPRRAAPRADRRPAPRTNGTACTIARSRVPACPWSGRGSEIRVSPRRWPP